MGMPIINYLNEIPVGPRNQPIYTHILFLHHKLYGEDENLMTKPPLDRLLLGDCHSRTHWQHTKCQWYNVAAWINHHKTFTRTEQTCHSYNTTV